MNNLKKTNMELHDMLKTSKTNMAKPRTPAGAAPVLAIREGNVKKKKSNYPNGKCKGKLGAPNPTLTLREKERLNLRYLLQIIMMRKYVSTTKKSDTKRVHVLNKFKAKGCGTSCTFMIKLHSTSHLYM